MCPLLCKGVEKHLVLVINNAIISYEVLLTRNGNARDNAR
jgi:hypothetical protein